MSRYLPLLLLPLLLAGGCATTVTSDDPPRFSADQYNRVFDAARVELREQGFYLDREDRRFGQITAEPEPVGTVFEPWHWRKHSTADAGEATTNQRRRRVRVILEPVADTSSDEDGKATEREYRLRIEALIEQYQRSTVHLTGTSRAGSLQANYHELPTDYRKIVVTDDDGRFVVPELPEVDFRL
ncbi:MAG: hypothetical protein R3336_03930, partial [Phycisphaeraceae bacterium]|nr:hypothetical protein [Phycisphaeraceae bacterium]